MRARNMAAMIAGAAAAALLGACGSGADDGANVANYSEEAIEWNEADSNAAVTDALNGTEANLGVSPLDVGNAAAGNYTNGGSASGEEAAPVERKKRRP